MQRRVRHQTCEARRNTSGPWWRPWLSERSILRCVVRVENGSRSVIFMPEKVETIGIQLTVNGKPRAAMVEPRMLLVELLREEVDLTGTHVGCDTIYCGACTVLMNGEAVKSCTMFAVQADGREIRTVEGLEQNGQ